MLDVARARQETPGCTHVLHFNNAGAALMPQPVFDAVTAHWTSELTIGGVRGRGSRGGCDRTCV